MTAVISGVEKTIQALFQLSPLWHGFTISSALIGTVAGSLFAGTPADKYGRKPVLFVIKINRTFDKANSGLYRPFALLFLSGHLNANSFKKLPQTIYLSKEICIL